MFVFPLNHLPFGNTAGRAGFTLIELSRSAWINPTKDAINILERTSAQK